MKANKNIFQKFESFLESIPTKWPEFAVLCLYTILLAVITYYHEPWFDEAQSWLIARSASLKEMFLTLPHYEGHPPFWWMILAPFAKAGLSYEPTIKAINIFLCSFGVFLFLFKSPFKRTVKFLIPFTYFIFYQYGVISRCYCLVIIAFMFVSITYRNRNSSPFAYLSALMLLCFSHAFGTVVSGGLAIVWILELWPFVFKDILYKKQFWALALLLIWALFLISLLLPYSDTFATNLLQYENTAVERFLFLIFIVPFNALTGVCNFYFLQDASLNLTQILLASPFMIALLFILKGFNKFLLFFLPYLLFALFASMVYFSMWHCGFAFLFILFVFWVIAEEKYPFVYPSFIQEHIKKLSKKLFYVIVLLILFLSVCCSFYNAQYDVKNQYDYSRSLAKIIKQYHLEDKVIFSQWIVYSLTEPNKKILECATHLLHISILPYFEKNIINNLNFGSDAYPYDLHKMVDNESYYKEWAKGSKPDIKLGGNFPLDMVWPDISAEEDDFIAFPLILEDNPPIYIRRSLAREIGLI